jgi:hypothetical protein
MSQGTPKPWPLPNQTVAPEVSTDSTTPHSIACKENVKVGMNSPSKAVAKKEAENRSMNIDEQGGNPNGAASLGSGGINRVGTEISNNVVPDTKGLHDGSISVPKTSILNSDITPAASGKGSRRAGEQAPENSVLQASARPIVIPIQKVFAPVNEGLFRPLLFQIQFKETHFFCDPVILVLCRPRS